MDEHHDALATELARHAAAIDFSGVVRIERGGRAADFARGYAHRAARIANAADIRFGGASVTKGLTALTTLSLVEAGTVSLGTSAASIVGDLVEHLDPAITIDHLLTHRSGVGDYLDESAVDDVESHVLGRCPVHTLERPADYAELLAGLPPSAAPGERFTYNNGGYVILSMIVERLTGSFRHAVAERVFKPARMHDSGFFRSDRVPERVALGYLADGRSNVFHLPVIGAGDGGVYLTAPDCTSLWSALFDDRIVGPGTVSAMTTPVSTTDDGTAYGRGVWLDLDADHVWLEGMDAGVSAQTGRIRSADLTYAVLSNTSTGAWPLVRLILEHTR